MGLLAPHKDLLQKALCKRGTNMDLNIHIVKNMQGNHRNLQKKEARLAHKKGHRYGNHGHRCFRVHFHLRDLKIFLEREREEGQNLEAESQSQRTCQSTQLMISSQTTVAELYRLFVKRVTNALVNLCSMDETMDFCSWWRTLSVCSSLRTMKISTSAETL